MSYFNYFPIINYSDVSARNIILKSAIINQVLNNVDAFYPYIIKEGMRADQVAYEVYGNPFYDWIVYFSNNIVDPYYQWPLDSADFNSYLQKKYNKTSFELQSDISHYEYTGLTNDSAEDIARKSWFMTENTFNSLPSEDRSGWTSVSVYDYESRLNDEKRSIKLLLPIYVPQITQELSEIFFR